MRTTPSQSTSSRFSETHDSHIDSGGFSQSRRGDSDTPIKLPKYRLHRASGNAVVTLCGRDVYLGRHGTAASKQAFARAIAEFLASGGAPPMAADNSTVSVSELVLRYWKFVKKSYNSRTYNSTAKPALKRLRALYGSTPASAFGPLKLEALRESLLAESSKGKKLSRPYVNRLIKETRRLFKWGVSKELVPATVHQALTTVEGLRYGRCNAPEPEPIHPVSDVHVTKTLPHLSRVVADMVRVHRLTGMRPAEVCGMTWGQIDISRDVWVYSPRHHKTLHSGKFRKIIIGPKAQTVLREYLTTDLNRAIFRPSDSVADLKRRWREQSETPMTPSRRARDARRAKNPRRVFNDMFTSTNYAQAIRRGCEGAEIPCWAPNRLRHARATEIRAELGLEAAGAVLGHAKLETTQIYAEKQIGLAMEIARKSG